MARAESALVLLVPEAEQAVRELRDQYDAAAAAGMPAHITVLYPFKAPDEISRMDIERLAAIISECRPFTFRLSAVGSFGREVLFLAAEPVSAFDELATAVHERYPETPLYGGRYSQAVPHLTIANGLPESGAFTLVEHQAADALRSVLPLTAQAIDVVLMDNSAGRWMIRAKFPLGG